MLITAAVCPHPPLLVPAMAGAAAPELDALRAACDQAVRALSADALIVVGGDETTRDYGQDVRASLRPYGLDWTRGPAHGEPLPLSLTIGHWLLENAIAPDVPVRYQAVAYDAEPAACLALGCELAASAERVALLVMGDGTACRSEKAPGYLDERAEPFDTVVADALGNADTAALAALDPGLSQDLRAAGRAAWQVLAGAAGGPFEAELLAHEAPYGVAYFVANWSRAT